MGCSASYEDEEELNGGDDEFGDLPNITPLGNRRIEDVFEIERELGRGGSCRVLRVKKIDTGEHFAMKELLKEDPWNPILFRQEIHILTTLRHPNILEYQEAYIGTHHFYICTTMCTGGELFEKVKQLRHFSEKKAAEVLKVILTGVAHIHANKLAHRDLKPENIVFDRPDGNLVLIDFGDAAEIESDQTTFSDFVGTPFYLAPECVRHRFGWELYKSDCWAVGVIAYVLLTGRPPFWGRNNREILLKITKKNVTWPKHVQLSRPCKHFILSLLNKDTRKRMSAARALQHPWILKEAEKIDKHLGDEVLQNIANFSNACKLKKLIVHRMVQEMNDEEKQIIATAFRELDENGDGKIDKDELRHFLSNTGLSPEDVEIRTEQLFEAMDQDKDGTIDLDEFIYGKTADRLASDANLLEKQFTDLDRDGDGQISIKEIKAQFGDSMKPGELDELIKEIDVDGDGQLSIAEFKKAMMGDLDT